MKDVGRSKKNANAKEIRNWERKERNYFVGFGNYCYYIGNFSGSRNKCH